MAIIGLILGIFKFLDEVKWLVKLLQGTPEAQRESLMTKMREESDKLAQTGRPTW